MRAGAIRVHRWANFATHQAVWPGDRRHSPRSQGQARVRPRFGRAGAVRMYPLSTPGDAYTPGCSR